MTRKTTTNNQGIPEDTFNKLSIQVSLNGLSFCILDTIGKKILEADRIVFEKSLPPFQLVEQLKALFDKHRLASKQFSEVTVIHSNTLFSFVPKPLFNTAELANYLKFNTKILANDHLAFDELESHDLVNVYVPFANINNYVFELFGEFEYRHNGTVLVQALLNNPTTSQEPICYVHIAEDQMDITVLSRKKLLLYNSFAHRTKEDFIYYLLFTMEQLDLDIGNTQLRLFGAIEEGDPFILFATNT